MTMPDRAPTAGTPAPKQERGRKPKRHPARRARRAVGAASVTATLLITGGLAVTHATSATSTATTGGSTATTATTGTPAATSSNDSTTTTTAVTKAQSSTPTTTAQTTTSGS